MIVKVCGMRHEYNILALEKLDIDWIGFIFFPDSPRYVTDQNEFLAAIMSCSKKKVGVFVNENPEEILTKIAKYQLDYVQLHGDESPTVCQQLHSSNCAIIKAFPILSAKDFMQTKDYEPFVKYFLFDTKSSKRGGTGIRFDWSVLGAYCGSVPFLLSGGIAPEHAVEIKNIQHPQIAGIDLNSRFELSPAVKDPYKLEKFIEKIR